MSLGGCPSRVCTTEYTQWQWPLSGVHSIMMVKSAQANEGGGGDAQPLPFTLSTIKYKVVVYAPAERAYMYTLPISSLSLYVLCGFYRDFIIKLVLVVLYSMISDTVYKR